LDVDVFDVVDWRRRVFEVYAAVRRLDDCTAAHQLWSGVRDELFKTHPASPLQAADSRRNNGLPVAPYDSAWRFCLTVMPAPPARIEIATGTDGVVPLERIGYVHAPEVGRLSVWYLASYGGGIFVPVKDATAGSEGGSYGGGRYLIDSVKGADLGSSASTLVLDFNFAYNPSCAYDPAWACPLAQQENAVSVPIPVGETMPHASEPS
jgi:uncharacterized protein